MNKLHLIHSHVPFHLLLREWRSKRLREVESKSRNPANLSLPEADGFLLQDLLLHTSLSMALNTDRHRLFLTSSVKREDGMSQTSSWWKTPEGKFILVNIPVIRGIIIHYDWPCQATMTSSHHRVGHEVLEILRKWVTLPLKTYSGSNLFSVLTETHDWFLNVSGHRSFISLLPESASSDRALSNYLKKEHGTSYVKGRCPEMMGRREVNGPVHRHSSASSLSPEDFLLGSSWVLPVDSAKGRCFHGGVGVRLLTRAARIVPLRPKLEFSFFRESCRLVAVETSTIPLTLTWNLGNVSLQAEDRLVGNQPGCM